MRAVVLLSVGAAVVGSFFLGRLSNPAPASAAKTGEVLTAREGQTLRIPAVATRCVVAREGGVPDMLCDHAPRGLYEVVLFSKRLFIYKNGDPDHPRFSARWKR